MKKFYEMKQFGKRAEIKIYGDITKTVTEEGEVSATSFNKELSKLNNVSQVDIYFNSPGGSVFEGMAIYHQIKRHPARFTGYVDGVAASISSVILMACDEVVMPSNAYLMIHNPFMGVVGNQNDLRKTADDLERMREASINAYLDKAKDKLTREKIIEIMDNETWMLGVEAFEYGLCDRLEKPAELVANVELKGVMERFNKVPEVLIDEVGAAERKRIIQNIEQEKVEKNMNTIKYTDQEKMEIAKRFQENYILGMMKGSQANEAIDYKLDHKLKGEIANSIATGTESYRQAMLATTGRLENDGDAFIPHGLQADVITERNAYNPLLPFITLSQGRLDEVVRLITSIDDDELIQDGEVAKELELKGEVVAFKPLKGKYFADFSETIELGTTTNVKEKVQSALASVLSMKELKLMFGDTSKEEQQHMNLYKNGIQEVTGADTYQAINNSIESLSYFFRSNAIVVMNEKDFKAMRFELAGKGLCRLDSKAEDLFNRTVIFVDEVTHPIVGDFKYYQLNYERVLFEVDKDYNKGIVKAILTPFFDAHVLLSSAFRVSKIQA